MTASSWKERPIGEIARIVTGGTPSRNEPSYWDGDIPWVRTTEVQNCIIDVDDIPILITETGLKNSSAKMVPTGTILMALIGQGKTRGQVALLRTDAAINQNCAAITLNAGHDPGFYYQYFLSQYEQIRNLSNSAGQSNLNGSTVKELDVPVPSLGEQRRIAKILFTWDEAIQTSEKLIANSEAQKRGLMQQLFSGTRRLPGFNIKWRSVYLRSLLNEAMARNKDCNVERVLSVTNHSGFVLAEEHFSKRVASADVQNYKVVRKGQFAYNPSRLNVGSFGRLSKYDVGILSPMYVVFAVDESALNSDYFFFWMTADDARQRILSNVQGSVRDSVSFDALCSFPFSLPPIAEQVAIAKVLTAADEQIEQTKRSLAALKAEKSALMQQLLTGKRRVKLPSAQEEAA